MCFLFVSLSTYSSCTPTLLVLGRQTTKSKMPTFIFRYCYNLRGTYKNRLFLRVKPTVMTLAELENIVARYIHHPI